MSNTAKSADPVIFVSAFRSGEDGAIHAYRFDSEKGQLTFLNRTTDVENPFFLAISPSGRFLYSIDAKEFGGPENEFVAAYQIDKHSRELTRLNRQSSLGTASCYLDIDASSQTIVVANYTTGSVAALPIFDDGSLGKASGFVQHSGASIDPKRQTKPHAHCIVVSPDNRFALAADLGTDKVTVYRLNLDSSELTVNPVQPFVKLPPGSGPRHLTFHPNGRNVYVVNELSNTVLVFDYNAEQGVLEVGQSVSTLPPEFSGTSHTADLKITPDGRFLYATNRGHDSIAIYRISKSGELTLLGIEPSLGNGPQNLLITPDGRWLLCANMPGNSLVVFSIDQETGTLTPRGKPLAIPMPSCIRWLK